MEGGNITEIPDILKPVMKRAIVKKKTQEKKTRRKTSRRRYRRDRPLEEPIGEEPTQVGEWQTVQTGYGKAEMRKVGDRYEFRVPGDTKTYSSHSGILKRKQELYKEQKFRYGQDTRLIERAPINVLMGIDALKPSGDVPVSFKPPSTVGSVYEPRVTEFKEYTMVETPGQKQYFWKPEYWESKEIQKRMSGEYGKAAKLGEMTRFIVSPLIKPTLLGSTIVASIFGKGTKEQRWKNITFSMAQQYKQWEGLKPHQLQMESYKPGGFGFLATTTIATSYGLGAGVGALKATKIGGKALLVSRGVKAGGEPIWRFTVGSAVEKGILGYGAFETIKSYGKAPVETLTYMAISLPFAVPFYRAGYYKGYGFIQKRYAMSRVKLPVERVEQQAIYDIMKHSEYLKDFKFTGDPYDITRVQTISDAGAISFASYYKQQPFYLKSQISGSTAMDMLLGSEFRTGMFPKSFTKRMMFRQFISGRPRPPIGTSKPVDIDLLMYDIMGSLSKSKMMTSGIHKIHIHKFDPYIWGGYGKQPSISAKVYDFPGFFKAKVQSPIEQTFRLGRSSLPSFFKETGYRSYKDPFGLVDITRVNISRTSSIKLGKYEFFHGTPKENIPSIFKQGLLPSKSGVAYEGGSKVFLTKDYGVAKIYGQVLKVALTKNQMKLLTPDEAFPSIIPKKQISANLHSSKLSHALDRYLFPKKYVGTKFEPKITGIERFIGKVGKPDKTQRIIPISPTGKTYAYYKFPTISYPTYPTTTLLPSLYYKPIKGKSKYPTIIPTIPYITPKVALPKYPTIQKIYPKTPPSKPPITPIKIPPYIPPYIPIKIPPYTPPYKPPYTKYKSGKYPTGLPPLLPPPKTPQKYDIEPMKIKKIKPMDEDWFKKYKFREFKVGKLFDIKGIKF